jgi:uncharacterized protein YegL
MVPTLEQQPFAEVGLVENPEPRCPCVLLLDTSGSMAGGKIDQLNEGLRVFEQELKSDSMAAKRVEIAIVTFGPVQIAQTFVTADGFIAPTLTASGDTPMGGAIEYAVEMVKRRKSDYKAAGVGRGRVKTT